MEFTKIKAYEAGIAPEAIIAMLDEWADKSLELHSFMLLRGGKLAAETWWSPYKPEYVHMLNSLSKSFTSTGVLFAIQEGLLSPDDKVVSFFPEQCEKLNVGERTKRMTLRHLLSMCTGHVPNADFIFGEKDCVSAFLASEPQNEPGSVFSYNTGATFMLSAILQTVSGQPLDEFLRSRLFEPLGMSKSIWWEKSALGICYGGFGLNVTTGDIARLGTLYLNRGVFDGKRILDEKLIDEATRRHISNCGSTQTPWLDSGETGGEGDTDPSSDWGMGYCWQFWRCIPRGIYRGDGAFGQYCIVMPEQNAVMAVTAGVSDMQAILKAIWDKLLPGINAGGSPVSSDGQVILDEMLTSRALIPVEGAASSDNEAALDGKTYHIACDRYTGNVSFNFKGGELDITLEYDNKKQSIRAGYGRLIENTLELSEESTYNGNFRFMTAPDFSVSYAWNKNGALIVKCILVKYAYTESAEIITGGDGIDINITMNIQVDKPFTLKGKAV